MEIMTFYRRNYQRGKTEYYPNGRGFRWYHELAIAVLFAGVVLAWALAGLYDLTQSPVIDKEQR